MTNPTTPRSTRHSPPDNGSNGDAHSQDGGSPTVITPGAKIRALLAQFDSDDDQQDRSPKALENIPATDSSTRANHSSHESSILNDDSEDDDEDLVIVPRGRLAARLQDSAQGTQIYEANNIKNVSKSSSPGRSASVVSSSKADSESEDDIRAAGRRKQPVQSSSPSNSSRRSESPLFVPMVSPSRSAQGDTRKSSDESGDDDGQEETIKARLLALVAQKRKEREERERLEAKKKAESAQRSSDLDIEFRFEDDESEDGTGRKLSKQSRPTRRASKKAIMEMDRETQRISRNMQLAHQEITKKKITLESFFARFAKPRSLDQDSSEDAGNSAATGSHPSSDVEAHGHHSTPPTSPTRSPDFQDDELAAKSRQVIELNEEDAAATSHISDTGSNIPISTQNGSGERAPGERKSNDEENAAKELKRPKRPVRVHLSRQAVAETQRYDSDSELEIVTSPSKARRLAVFENLPLRNARQSRSLLTLKALAHLTSPSRNNKGLGSMTQAELEATLLRKAREQAAKEREEKIRRLREKGIIIQTAEERAKMENEVEDLVEKAREEAEAIAKREKAAAKKDGELSDDLSDDESGDEDYEGGQDDMEIDSEEEEDSELEAQSGPNEKASDDEHEEANESNGESELIENQAKEASDSEHETNEMEDDYLDQVNASKSRWRGRAKLVVDDDEDDEPESAPAPIVSTPKPRIPNLGKQSSQIMGLSQAFAATLANTQDGTQEVSLEKLRQMPGIDLPVSEILELDSQAIVRDSQDQESGSLDLLGSFTQTGIGVTESPGTKTLTEYSQIPEPTQDAGFVMSPFDQTKRFIDPPDSTIDTVLLDPENTPMVKKGMRRLKRGTQVEHAFDGKDGVATRRSAFDVMRKAAKKSQMRFDKKNSEAKEIVDEVAEESDDEYAGLGGASDEGSDTEDEYDREMINDNSGEVVDEKELAALNANFERERDERDVNKLMKDITTGAFRRKRGAGGDLDLSESEDERLEARRRAKRREFAKMRKALLADEKLNKLADDPKKAAFLRSIEDRDYDDESDFLDHELKGDNLLDIDTSQENKGEEVADGVDASETKRPLDSTTSDALNRMPAKFRRKAAMKKPTSLAEIRQSVSFILNGPDAAEPSPLEEALSAQESEGEDELSRPGTTVRHEPESNDPLNHGNFNGAGGHTIERTASSNHFSNPRRQRGKVVDRLTLRRQASSNLMSTTTASKLAFQTTNLYAAAPSFHGRPPLLSRRSTAAASTSSTNGSRSSNLGASEVTVPSGVGGSKKAAVNYYSAAREQARAIELRRKLNERREKRGLEMLKENGDRLRGLLNASMSSQWE
ncbi:hypothetical protein VTO42DRAFT_4401 [Malbranchea cinnamomea]